MPAIVGGYAEVKLGQNRFLGKFSAVLVFLFVFGLVIASGFFARLLPSETSRYFGWAVLLVRTGICDSSVG